jgi:ABC-2 type transport system permease protein
MTARARELLAVPVRAARRAGLVWGSSLAALIVLTVAFYPAFRDQPELSNLIAGMPSALVDAFGLADFGTPAGFLRGNLYAVLVPLMLALAGVLLMNGQTAADEDSGRMEPYLAQPVTRVAVFLGRGAGVLIWVLAIGGFMLAAQLACDVLFGIDIGTDRVVATVVLCVLLGAWHAGVAALIAGWSGRPGLVRGGRPVPAGPGPEAVAARVAVGLGAGRRPADRDHRRLAVSRAGRAGGPVHRGRRVALRAAGRQRGVGRAMRSRVHTQRSRSPCHYVTIYAWMQISRESG